MEVAPVTPEVIVAICTAGGAVVGAVVEHMRRHHESDLRERLARCEARLDALERQP